jgi:ABC-2 type transport system ATP-binding protein
MTATKLAPIESFAPIPTREPPVVAVQMDRLTKRFPIRRTWYEMMRHPLATEHATAVNAVSCTIHAGELFGLLGPNGAGKTTLFKMLTSSTTPDEGRATVLGYDAELENREVRSLVACVWANERNLFWRLSARENLRLFATLYKLHGAQRKKRIDEVLECVELADCGEKMVATFSSGMKQRLLIARALLSQPKLLLLDEPTRSLDPISARRFRDFLRTEIVGRKGCTVVLATHNTEEAMELCDRVAILDHGRLLAVGTSGDLGRQFGDQIYSLWTRSPDHPAILMLDAEHRVRILEVLRAENEGGWYRVTLEMQGGMDRSVEILNCLVQSGVDVARFEHRTLSLADLIERVVKSSAAETV